MKRRKMYMMAAGVLAVGLALTGCSAEDRVRNGDDLRETSITLGDGRQITCVVYDDSRYAQGGVSCDWGDQ